MWIIISWILDFIAWLCRRTHLRSVHSPTFDKPIFYFTNDEMTAYFEDKETCATMSRTKHYHPFLKTHTVPILIKAHVEYENGGEYVEGALYDTISTIVIGRMLHEHTKKVFPKDELEENELCILSDISRRFIKKCSIDILDHE
jgi:hypothetical protein